jgi:hypothetical protein
MKGLSEASLASERESNHEIQQGVSVFETVLPSLVQSARNLFPLKKPAVAITPPFDDIPEILFTAPF